MDFQIGQIGRDGRRRWGRRPVIDPVRRRARAWALFEAARLEPEPAPASAPAVVRRPGRQPDRHRGEVAGAGALGAAGGAAGVWRAEPEPLPDARIPGAAPVARGAEEEAGSGDGAAGRRRVRGALRELPVWLRSRCGVRPKSLAVLALMLLPLGALAVHHFWTGRPQTVSPPALDAAAPEFGRGASPGGALDTGQPAGSPPGGGSIVVDVVGEVRDPGVHKLPFGARVTDALRAAGGVRPGTDTAGLNRARRLGDGELLVVGAVPPGGVPAGAPTVGGGATTPSAPLSLSSATVDQLETLPGVGPVLAQHIVDYRTAHGGFTSVDELREVNGIGDRRFNELRTQVTP